MSAEQGTEDEAPCPACGTKNDRGVPRCSSCGTRITKRRRRGAAAHGDTPFSPADTENNRPALRAYRLALLSLAPGVGLFVGPVAFVSGIKARRRGGRDPLFTAYSPAMAAVILGGLTAITNWVGFMLMYLGLRAAGWL